MKEKLKNKINRSLEALGNGAKRDKNSKNFDVLIVDDEPFDRGILSRLVTSFGYDCAAVEDGQEAVAYLESHPCDLILADMVMPNMDGMQLLKHIKIYFPEVSVIVLTGYSPSYSFKEIIQEGAFDFMLKPIEKDILEARLERAFYEKTMLEALKTETKSQAVLIELLNLAAQNKSLEELLNCFIVVITSFPWLELEPKGAVFLVDENDANKLVLKTHYQLAAPIQIACAGVPFGQCLCGQVAEKKEIVFSSHLDIYHHNTYRGIEDHGHYCVPILFGDNFLGVFTLYTKAGIEQNQKIDRILMAAGSTIAAIIKRFAKEESVRQSEKRYQLMTNSVLDAIIMMDDKGDITFWNKAAEDIFGYPAGQVMGMNLHDLIAPECYKERYATALKHFFRSGDGPNIGKNIEMEARCNDGIEIPVELMFSSLKINDKWHAVGIVRDISSRKKMEAEKEKLNEQLRQAQKMESIGTLAGGIAHDFNNILGAIIGFADIAQDEVPAGSQIHADLHRILAAGNRAKELVCQILAFSRQQEQKAIPVNVNLIFKEALKLLRATIPANIEIRQDFDPECKSVMADPIQLHQLIMNLCTNAYYAMKKTGGLLSLSLKNQTVEAAADVSPLLLSPGQYVRVSIEDTGVGMDSEVKQQIFEPYYTTKPQGEGTGLGLSVVHGIVSELGGAISVESEEGKGTAFTIFLPALLKDAEVESSGLPDYLPLGSGQHVLLVDDEVALLDVISRILRKLNYRVSPRTSSLEALELFKSEPDRFDLLITDLAMPNMTGLEMSAIILEIKPDLPVIIATGYADVNTPDYAMRIGVRKIISKPINHKELAHTIRDILAEGSRGDERIPIADAAGTVHFRSA